MNTTPVVNQQQKIEEVKAAFREKMKLATIRNQNANLMNNLYKIGEADRAVIEMFEKISNVCGGDEHLSQLFQTYLRIKQTYNT